ncbi:MAG: hypothetical protein AAF764_00160 [Pseudomonadota bacterium]
MTTASAKHSALPADHPDKDYGYNHKMRVLAIATANRTAKLKRMVAEKANCPAKPAQWIEDLFEKDRTKIKARKRDMQKSHQEILRKVMEDLLGREVDSDVFNMTIDQFNNYIKDGTDFVNIRMPHDESIQPGVYLMHRFSSSSQAEISTSVVILKKGEEIRKASFMMRASTGDPISESHGVWSPNKGGSFVYTSHYSVTNPKRVRIRTLIIGHDDKSLRSGFWFGTFSTTTVEEFDPISTPIVLETTRIDARNDAKINAAVNRREIEKFEEEHEKGRDVLVYLTSKCRKGDSSIITSSREGHRALGI